MYCFGLLTIHILMPVQGASVSIAPGVMDVMAKAESDRQRNGGNQTDDLEKKLSEQMAKIVEQAKKMQGNAPMDQKETEKLLGEFGTLLQVKLSRLPPPPPSLSRQQSVLSSHTQEGL